MPLFEGDYTPRLKFLAQLPPGKVAAHFDRIDRRKFKEVCGDTMCFWGNVQNSLLATGTPQQVKDDIKELVDIMGDRLILDGVGASPTSRSPRTSTPSAKRWTSAGCAEQDPRVSRSARQQEEVDEEAHDADEHDGRHHSAPDEQELVADPFAPGERVGLGCGRLSGAARLVRRRLGGQIRGHAAQTSSRRSRAYPALATAAGVGDDALVLDGLG
jgi:hypothetical protein